MSKVDCHFQADPKTGIATECGDTGLIQRDGKFCFLALIDALGHGPRAYEIACRAREYLQEHYRENLIALMQGLHEHLKGTIGAVGSLCRLDTETGELACVGIGNITVKILGVRPHTFVQYDGIIGYLLRTPREQYGQLIPGDILLMHSDGIFHNISIDELAGFLQGDAAAIVRNFMEHFRKNDDDASCISVRFS